MSLTPHPPTTGQVISLPQFLARRAQTHRHVGERVTMLRGRVEVTGTIAALYPRTGRALILCDGPTHYRGVAVAEDCHHLIPIDERGFAQPESGGAA